LCYDDQKDKAQLEETMHLFKFRRGTDFGLTRDQSGKNLPGAGKDWQFVKEIAVHRAEDAARIGVFYQDVTKHIADDGFYIWPTSTAGPPDANRSSA
jgi:hypothetical protein